MTTVKEKISHCWSGEILWDCSLKNYTTLRVGGPADAVVKPQTVQQLVDLIHCLNREGVPWRVLGRGSNVVVADQGLCGVVIVFGSGFAKITRLANQSGAAAEQEDARMIYVEAGCSLAKLINWCKDNSLAGLEFAAGIPGSVGGAIMMNAGAWGKEMKDVLLSVDVITEGGDMETEQLTVNDFAYRTWKKRDGKVVVGALLQLSAGEKNEIHRQCCANIAARKEKQPKGVASAGSFFKNPAQVSAGEIIDKAGLKGAQVGGAQVSEKHANFLVNAGNASARDFQQLMQHVQSTVLQKYNVVLEPEVEFIGS